MRLHGWRETLAVLLITGLMSVLIGTTVATGVAHYQPAALSGAGLALAIGVTWLVLLWAVLAAIRA